VLAWRRGHHNEDLHMPFTGGVSPHNSDQAQALQSAGSDRPDLRHIFWGCLPTRGGWVSSDGARDRPDGTRTCVLSSSRAIEFNGLVEMVSVERHLCCFHPGNSGCWVLH